jgi:hypothetical protein
MSLGKLSQDIYVKGVKGNLGLPQVTLIPPLASDGGLGTWINGLNQKNVLLPVILSLWRANIILLTCFVDLSEAFSFEDHDINAIKLHSVQSCNAKSHMAICRICFAKA